ncbi:MAG: hypothetical protein GX640_23130 [Fibrobacter sp.]|mgnify:CR=1 FL=1|nr:hypothetical protein [Fibrobacter sp.]
MASEFAFKVYNEPSVFLSIKNTVGAGSAFSGNYIFAERIVDGKLKLLRVYEKVSTPGFYNPNTKMMLGGSVKVEPKMILKMDDKDPIMPSLITFRKRVSEYLSDCPDISVKIENKLYTIKDIRRVVEEYNAMCK